MIGYHNQKTGMTDTKMRDWSLQFQGMMEKLQLWNVIDLESFLLDPESPLDAELLELMAKRAEKMSAEFDPLFYGEWRKTHSDFFQKNELRHQK